VTQIINQNTINNYIIQNPEKVDIIEYGPAKAQPIPGIKPTTMNSLNKPKIISAGPNNNNKEHTIKKIIPPKKVSQVRSASAAVRREVPKTSPLAPSQNKNRETVKPNSLLKEKKYNIALIK
jgi:hypothetical protein